MIEVQPKDPSKRHFYISLMKSLVRIAAGLALIKGELVLAGSLLVTAEVLGIAEEF